LDTKIVTLSHCNRPLVTLCSCSDVAVSTFCYSISINKNGSDYMNKLTHVHKRRAVHFRAASSFGQPIKRNTENSIEEKRIDRRYNS
jgi:uncharacterized metal-binding protein